MMFKIFLHAALFSMLALFVAAEAEKRQFDDLTSGAASIFGDVTSFGGSVISEGASGASELFETVTSIGGQAVTVVSSVGGEVFTKATDGIGAVTTVAGSVFTVATSNYAAATSQLGNDNAAVSLGVSLPVIASLAMSLVGVYIGAWTVL